MKKYQLLRSFLRIHLIKILDFKSLWYLVFVSIFDINFMNPIISGMELLLKQRKKSMEERLRMHTNIHGYIGQTLRFYFLCKTHTCTYRESIKSFARNIGFGGIFSAPTALSLLGLQLQRSWKLRKRQGYTTTPITHTHTESSSDVWPFSETRQSSFWIKIHNVKRSHREMI